MFIIQLLPMLMRLPQNGKICDYLLAICGVLCMINGKFLGGNHDRHAH